MLPLEFDPRKSTASLLRALMPVIHPSARAAVQTIIDKHEAPQPRTRHRTIKPWQLERFDLK